MKKIENVKIEVRGEQLIDENKEKICSLTCIKAVLNNCEYKNREDQRQADKIYQKLEKLENEVKEIELEDAEFELIKKYVEDYIPFRRGRTFVPFLNSLEDGEK